MKNLKKLASALLAGAMLAFSVRTENRIDHER